MLHKSTILGVIFGLCLTSSALASNKIGLPEARKVALARVPGTIVHEKLKHGKKSQHDHYNIKIKPRDHAKADHLKKVQIDAETGAILEVKDVKAKSSDKSNDD